MWTDEFNLIKNVQQWDFNSFTPLYEMYFQKIYSFLLIKANGNVQLAEDATSSTFIKAFENINKFSLENSESSFVAWLFNIWYHSLIDLVREKNCDSLEENNFISENSNYVEYFQKLSKF